MISNNRGITLVELIISIAIMGVITLAIISFFDFGNKSFIYGKKKSDLQHQVQLVSDIITEEIRNATEISLIATPASFTADSYCYIAISGQKIILVDNGISTDKTEAIINENVPMFTLTRLSNGNNFVSFTISGTIDSQDYEVTTKVALNNIKNSASNTGQAIRYKKP